MDLHFLVFTAALLALLLVYISIKLVILLLRALLRLVLRIRKPVVAVDDSTKVKKE